MPHSCCSPPTPAADPTYRKILWLALLLNAGMFAVEVAGSVHSGSMSLLADAVDFFSDAANYGISLAVLFMALAWRARAALLKAASMAAMGAFVLARALWSTTHAAAPPDPLTMGGIALLALVVNLAVALLLYRYRAGDSNMRSVWICSRNDALGNIAVACAALGVFGTGSGWPDLLVASGMAALALTGAWAVMQQARTELAQPARPA